jgi:LCP family protein required for cell wall assembly
VSDRTPPRDTRKIHVPAPTAGTSSLPPRPGGEHRAAAAAAPPRPAQPAAVPRPKASVAAPKTAPAPTPQRKGKRRRLLPHRPKLRRIFLLTSVFLPVLLLLSVVAGWLYARSVYDKVEKIPLTDVLSTGGSGTNYLLVGSDSRSVEDLIAAGLNPEAFEDGGGERSDTMLLLRFGDGGARMMSIPRDLYVPIAETGGSSKINAAYNGGPRRLILTIQQALGIPIHHYLEVDFVSFAGLVDSLGGITVDFPNPAFDTHSGLNVQQSGQVKLDGPQALAYVRSRHFVEVVNGNEQPDATADLGRVQRQQTFLSAVFGKLGGTRNPFRLASAASSASEGVRVDDGLGLSDAIRFAWRLRSLDPESVVLPTRLGNNSAGSVLFLVDPDAQTALDQFR